MPCSLPNISIFRLLTESVEDVLTTRHRYDALSLVPYEILPHINRHAARLLDAVGRYSAGVPHEIVGIPDGGFVSHPLLCLEELPEGTIQFRAGTMTRRGEI